MAQVIEVTPDEFRAVRKLADACETIHVAGVDEDRWVREIKAMLLDPRGLEVGAYELKVRW
jgi:hypothetical protein